MEIEKLISLVQEALEELKARDILLLDVRGKSSVTDYMLIASGTSNRHVKSLADNVTQAVKHAGIQPMGCEGVEVAEWALVDLGDLVVHVMQPQTRAFYDLERLWGPEQQESEG